MPKQSDIRLKDISFEDALRKMLHTPPPPSSKKAKQPKAAAKSPHRKK